MDDNTGSEFSSFMMESQVKEDSKKDIKDNKKVDDKSKGNALDKAKQDEKDEKKKKVNDAKKESKGNMSKYSFAQANVARAQGKQFLLALPFIIVGIIVFFMIVSKGGKWVQGGTNFLVRKVTGE
jgi:preprotein translocase subunit SecF